MARHLDQALEVFIEALTLCEGSCPGCPLSLVERKSPNLIALADLRLALSAFLRHIPGFAQKNRAVLVFGDFPAVPVPSLEALSGLFSELRVSFGLSATFGGAERAPAEAGDFLRLVRSFPQFGLVDATLDPFRMEHSAPYRAALRELVDSGLPYHLQMVMSQALIERFPPDRFARRLQEILGSEAICSANCLPPNTALRAMPGSRYDIRQALAWTRAFYDAHPAGLRHARDELSDFTGSAGNFSDFAQLGALHVNSRLDAFAIVHTPMGDFPCDERSGFSSLGNLRDETFFPSLRAKTIPFAARALSSMSANPLCSGCPHASSCSFFGAGALMRHYKSWDNKKDYCYGPAWLSAAEGFQA